MALVVEALDGRLLDGAVHPLDPRLRGADSGRWSTDGLAPRLHSGELC